MRVIKKLSRMLALALVFTMLFGMTANAAYVETENGFLYNETSARKVTVTVSISSDGYPILGNNVKQTPMELLEVTVPYFDLSLYGLERYYRYPTGDTGFWNSDAKEVVRRPTVLHLYIYLLEKYYLGLNENQCCKAYDKAGLFSLIQGGEVNNIWGEKAFSMNGAGYVPSGNAGSVYMTSFWGHDENLIYYLNGEYPLWRRGRGNEDALIGATHDYILLEDGDRVDIGMFSNTGFCWNINGGFLYFPEDTYTIRKDDTLTIDKITRKYGFMGTGFDTKTYFDDLGTYNYVVKTPDGSAIEVTDKNYEDGMTFAGFDEAGTYYIYAFDKAAGENTEDSEAICAPGIAKVVVKEASSEAVKEVLDKILAIKEVTYSDACKTKIEAARAAYDALSDEEKKEIFDAELTVLTDAEKVYGELKAEADKKVEEEQKQPEKEENKQPAEDENKKPEQQQPNKEPVVNEPSKDEKPGNDSAEEALKEAQIKAVKETAITSLKAKKYKTTGIKLTWKKNSSLDGYEVLRSTKKNAGYSPMKTVASATYTLKKGLNKNKAYYYKVRGYKVIDGSKVYTKESIICVNLNQTKAIKAIGITGLKAKVTKGKVTLTWDKHDSMYSLKGYKIYKSTKKNSGFKQVTTAKKEKTVIKKGLKKGKTYYFKIQGYAKVGKKTVTTKVKVIKVKAK